MQLRTAQIPPTRKWREKAGDRTNKLYDYIRVIRVLQEPVGPLQSGVERLAKSLCRLLGLPVSRKRLSIDVNWRFLSRGSTRSLFATFRYGHRHLKTQTNSQDGPL